MRLLAACLALVVLAACGDRATGPRRLSPAAENRLRGERFLRDNAKRPGVVELPSKLQYRVIRPGDGARPTLADTVTFHYRGTSIDGREFETSRDRGEKPVTAPVRDLIRGWQEGLQLMPVGSTYEFAIPAQLAYGLQGKPPAIAPNQCLVFTVELVGVNLPSLGN
jgi:FKBP-type peptidyl-prolyl cis-trans isomerase